MQEVKSNINNDIDTKMADNSLKDRSQYDVTATVTSQDKWYNNARYSYFSYESCSPLQGAWEGANVFHKPLFT